MHGGDSPRYRHFFWEHVLPSDAWTLFQRTVEETKDFGGREHVFHWQDCGRAHRENPNARIQGMDVWGHDGVVVSMMRDLPVTRYTGEKYDISCTPIVPTEPGLLPALWAFCSSQEYNAAVRKIDRNLKVTNATLIKVLFDREYWREVANAEYPRGLPEPYSDDPTQWLFHGHPAYAAPGTELHVALARIAGYRWPGETDSSMRLAALASERIRVAAELPATTPDGLLPLHAAMTAKSLAERLREMLAAAFGSEWSNTREQNLVRGADQLLDKREARDITLETWLRDRAFRQHCLLFHHRPFLWHIWDGLPDGFSAFVHYQRLDRATLERLTYSLLGDWIARAKAEGQTAREERAQQLQQRLAAILEGEQPHDIFVRWKPLARQPTGWEPDLDDGVRLNIRPFVEAEVLREILRGIHWNKDRGSDLASAPWFDLGPRYGEKPGDRINDHHLTLAEKHAARERLRQ
jgi:hypothetical protein